MKFAGQVLLVVCLASPALNAIAQGITLEELFDHVAKTNPRYQSIKLSPQYWELQYKSIHEADWFLSADTSFNRDHNRNDSYRYSSLNTRGGVSLNKRSILTGISGSISYNYSRYGSSYSSLYGDGSNKNYFSDVSTNVNVPLWNDAFGYSSRRNLEQNELELARNKLGYQSNKRSFFVEVNQQFISLCGSMLDASLQESAHKQALELASKVEQQSATLGGPRNIQHSSRYVAETAAALAWAQSFLENQRVAMSTYYDLPRLRSELLVCDLLQQQQYTTNDAELDKLINATIAMQALALDDRSLQLAKEIIYNQANPDLNLGLGYRVAGNDDEKSMRSLDRDDSGYRISLNLNYPIGNTRGHIAMDRVDLDRMQFSNTQRDSTLELQQNIRRSVSNLIEGEKIISTLKQRVQIARTTREQDMRAFEAGHLDIALLEESMRNELSAELSLATSAENYQRSFLLYRNLTDQFPVRNEN